MPVTWTISHKDRLVIAVAQGDLQAYDIERYLAALAIDGVMPYRKIFDLTNAIIGKGLDVAMAGLGVRIGAYAADGPIGPLAIVATTEVSYRVAQLYAARAIADRPLTIFRELHSARAWLDGQPAT
jgi:hypothetical protein